MSSQTSQRWIRVRAVHLCTLLVACGSSSSSEREARGPRLSFVDSVYLKQNDSLLIARPSLFAVSRRGDIFVGDAAAGQVFQFTPAGRHLGTFGKPGRGPGELDWTTAIFFPSDSVLAVGDDGQRRIVYFDLRDGSPITTTHYRGVLRSALAEGDSVWFGVLEQSALTALASGRLFSDSLAYWMPMPREYRESIAWRGIFTSTQLVGRGDSLLVAFNGLNSIYVVRKSIGVIDTLVIPAVRRRGISTRARRILGSTQGYTPAERIGSMSAFLNMGLLTSGEVALVFADMQREGGLTWAKGLFVGLLSMPRRRACVDTPLEVSDVSIPLVTFRGDTLYVLDQLLSGGTGSVRIRRFTMTSDGCSWLRLGTSSAN